MIRLRGARRRFEVGDTIVDALAGVDLDISDGEHVAIVGPSGSGKSTLLNVLGLLDRLSEGSYEIDTRNVTTLSDDALASVRRDSIGFVFQFFHLVPRLSAQDNVALPLMLAGVAVSERRERAAAALSDMGLADRAHHRPDQLSAGQRQRVAIARAVVTRPRLLLADEPTGNLDRASGREVVEILESLRDTGITLVVVTHDGDVAARAPREVRMVDGRVEHDACRAPVR